MNILLRPLANASKFLLLPQFMRRLGDFVYVVYIVSFVYGSISYICKVRRITLVARRQIRWCPLRLKCGRIAVDLIVRLRHGSLGLTKVIESIRLRHLSLYRIRWCCNGVPNPLHVHFGKGDNLLR